MKSLKVQKLIIVFIAIIIWLSVLFYHWNQMEQQVEEYLMEYPAVAIDQSLNAFVTGIDHGETGYSRNSPHHAYVTLDDSIKLRITATYELTRDITFDEVLRVGFHLVKVRGSDRFQLLDVRGLDTLRYDFKFQDDFMYPLEK